LFHSPGIVDKTVETSLMQESQAKGTEKVALYEGSIILGFEGAS
jgi:hypothetical protein